MRLEEKVPYLPREMILKRISEESKGGREVKSALLTHVFGTICRILRESEGRRRTTQALGWTRECIFYGCKGCNALAEVGWKSIAQWCRVLIVIEAWC